jgi:hypothetical protein
LVVSVFIILLMFLGNTLLDYFSLIFKLTNFLVEIFHFVIYLKQLKMSFTTILVFKNSCKKHF